MKIILIGNNSEELWFDRGTCISSFISDLLILRSKKSFTFIKYYSICYLLQVCNMLTAPEQWVGVKLQYIEQSVQVVVLVTCTCPKWSNNVSRYYCQWGNIIIRDATMLHKSCHIINTPSVWWQDHLDIGHLKCGCEDLFKKHF